MSRTQSDELKDAARKLEADEDEQCWEERLKKIAKRPPESPPQPRDPVVKKATKNGE